MYFNRSNKVLIALLSCFLTSASVFSIDEKKEEPQTLYLDGVQYSRKPTPTVPVVYHPKRTNGPLISSNVGYGYLFHGPKNVLRSPVYEFLAGYHIGTSLKLVGSYQYQQTNINAGHNGTTNIGTHSYRFNNERRATTFSLQSLVAKIIASPSEPARLSIFKLYPYISFGVGYGWAELKRVANFKDTVYLAEAGITAGANFLSVTLGCKYNRWALNNELYSLVPYVGLQIAF